jgi:glyoxylase I family protein
VSKTSTAAAVQALELALARRDEAAIPGGYEAVLDPDFLEVGASGRIWSRDETLVSLRRAARSDAIEIEGFELQEVAPVVLLARYDTVIRDPARGVAIRARRTSIWLERDGALRLRFHQGTPLPTDRT